LHVAFKILYVYDFITQVGSKQKSSKIRNMGQGEDMHRKYEA